MINVIKGMPDILPDEMPAWHFVEATARRIFYLYGFSEIRPPMLERTELFSRGMGVDTDVVEKQMYTFVDKSGTSLTLRPEATASVLRAVIENRLLNMDPIQKLYTMGPMFRYERPQKGRYREFHQINVERLGEEDYTCDAETLAMASELASSFGLEGVRMEVNSLGCDECRGKYKDALRAFLKKKKDMLCKDCVRRMDSNPMRVLDCKVPSCREAVMDAPLIEEFLCDGCRAHYEGLLRTLDLMHVSYEKNPGLVRGLDYYTRTTFEITASGLGSQNAVAGGGRYDRLVSQLGGPCSPGIGFAFGMERVIMLLGEMEHAEKGLFFVVPGGDPAREQALKLMLQLRSDGFRVDACLEKSFRAQMKRAGKSGCPLCIILGEDEMDNSMLTIKDMVTSLQVQVSMARAASEIRTMLGQEERV
ncbi:MAG: histidine--tRNA ligase [Thermodesulfobacteriota bacterium]|nr:histidine--tRNA ligase [Thermodesulfobacteriota bacterium]